MILSGIAQRYARALHQAALDANVADSVYEDVQSLLDLMAQDKRYKNFLMSPQVLTDDKVDLVKQTLQGRASKLLVELLLLLIEKKRFIFVEEIAEAYRYLHEKHKGIIEVKAVTAVPLEDQLKEKLLHKLEDQTKKTIRLVPEVDPGIIGGMILFLEDKIIDGSIRFNLDQLRKRLGETRVVQ
ncbi:MAG: ATP synthase F1 subunit delta [Candidatus Latescibacterota bacterium]|nr:MAG: ATP synthase F1 subunit delta [Candidatus Latescibacterota bacterium]